MNRSSQTALQLGGFAVLTALLLVNTWQLDRVEHRLIALEGGVTVRSGGSTATEATPPAKAGALLPWMEADNAALVGVEGEVLKGHTRLLVTAPHVQGGTLRRQFGSDTRSMNYFMNSGADGSEWIRYYSNQLAYRAPEEPDIWRPELATSVVTVDGGLTYTIKLRRGVKWQKPQVVPTDPGAEWFLKDREMVADDYVFSLDIIRNEQTTARAASLRNYFESVASYRAVDDHTLEVKYKEVLTSNLPNLLDLPPMPRWLYQYDESGHRYDDATWGLKYTEHWYNNRALGVGPYQLVRWEPGVVIEFERNPDYWGETPSFDHILIHILKDQQAWIRKLKSKELDYTNIQPEQYRTEIKGKSPPWLGEPRLKLDTHPTTSYFYIGWNLERPLFSDRRVRRALTMAFDRKGLLENVFHGLGDLVSGPFPVQSPCYDKTVEPWPYDLEAARKLLDEAGWTDTDGDGVRDKQIDGKKVPFEFSLITYGTSTEYETIASVYREALLSIGIKMRPEPVEWSTQQKRTQEREFDAFTGAWVPDWEVDLMQLWHSKEADRPGSSNYVSFRNPEADRIAEALRRAFEPEERNALCHQFHKLMHEEQPYTFFYQRRIPVLYWDWMNPPEFQIVWPNRDNRFNSFQEARP